MRKTLSALLLFTLVISGCGAIRDSRANPFNWFGNSRSAPVETQADAAANPLIPTRSGLFARARAQDAFYLGNSIDQITDLTVERVPGGAIIRATGRARFQGIYAVQLTPQNVDELPVDGVLIYRMEGVAPNGGALAGGTEQSREVTAARAVTDQTLAGVRSIRVEGARNAQVSRR